MDYKSVIDYYKEKAPRIRDEVERIADECYTKELQRLEKECSNKDLRNHFKHFNRSIRGELFSIRLHLAMLQLHLVDLNWWNLTHQIPPSYNQICHMIEAYDTNIKRGFLIGVFSQLEHCFRHFSRKVTGSTTDKENFWKIRTQLLGYLQKDKTKFYKSMLELFGNIRNTIHNDGLFYPKDGKDVIIEYRENNYSFKAQKAIDFVEWELLLEITEDIAHLLYDLSMCREIELAYLNTNSIVSKSIS